MKRFPLPPAAVLAALLISGCAARGPFPSLAQRPVETEPLADPARVVPEIVSEPALRSRISDLLSLARQGQRDFEAASATAAIAARNAGGRGSDSWVAAQEQISRAEAARARTMRALGDLDRLALQRADMATSVEDHSMLSAALDEAVRLAASQQDRIDALKALTVR